MSRFGRMWLFGSAVIGMAALAAWLTWAPPWANSTAENDHDSSVVSPAAVQQVRLSPQAQKNLAIVTKPVQLTPYWRKIELPGTIVDRPGVSDRGVVAPLAGIVTRIHAYPGDTIKPDSPLFTIRLVSESLYASQLQLLKATREIEINQKQLERLSEAAQVGAVARSRIIELENQVQLSEASAQAYRQDLIARGLSAADVDNAARGTFLTEITVRSPSTQAIRLASAAQAEAKERQPQALPFGFEMHQLKVELGEQVQAGQILCSLADHRSLTIEGRGFKNDMPLVQQAAKQGWAVEVEFSEASEGDWPKGSDKLQIQHVANTIDAESRTFAFFLSLENASQSYTREGQTRLLWRFRPGDRVRLRVAVEKLDRVIVVPKDAVMRDGPEAYVFRQNGDLFDRKPVHVLYEDRRDVVLANDGSIRPGFYIAQNAAASLNRVLKAQASSGTRANVHVHADGTVHAAH